jgi:glycosyltransferase involved in cell wall biosynthesis
MTPEPKLVAFCGTRGVPANYGGFETAVDEISKRFVENGVACEVFCRLSSSERTAEHAGRLLQHVRGSTRRSLDTFVSSFETGWHLIRNRGRYRHVFWFNNANLPGILMSRLAGIPTSVNTDGLEWRRAKWRLPHKLYYLMCSFVIARTCPTLISDSCAIQDYYRARFFKKTIMIAYGVPDVRPVPRAREDEILAAWNLERGRYFLQITRVEPDNLPLEIAVGFREAGLAREGFSLVSIGYKDDTPYSRRLKQHDGAGGIRICNAVYDPEVLQVLRTNCFTYVHGNSVGGTNPALLEAMNACPRVIALDCEFSREVLGDAATLFARDHIARDLRRVVETPERGAAMKERIAQQYQWDDVARAYAALVTSDAP